MSKQLSLYTARLKRAAKAALMWPRRYWHGGWWHKTVSISVIFVTLCVSSMYGIALWYQHTQKGKPYTYGVSFIADYASYLGVDPHQTFSAILNDLHVKHVRLVSYWNDIEPTQGHYDFSELDWEMQQAAAHGTKVSLSIGLRQPRWPECHPPSWVDTTKPTSTWEPQLNSFITAVVQRYRGNPALESYQLENEYFLKSFGDCHNFDRSRLTGELALVKRLDPHHPVIMSRSNNYAGFMVSNPLPDVVGISVYRHVWNTVLWQRYLTYPFPSWYYAFLAGAEQLLTGKPSVIHELQAEAWPPHGQDILHTSLTEQNKTLDASKLKAADTFAKQTGVRQVDFWGAEYWYYRAVKLHDPSAWNEARSIFAPKPSS